MKHGPIRFFIQGNRSWHVVFITNVAGPGEYYQGVHQRLMDKMDPHEPQLGCRISSVTGTTGAEPLLHACLRLHS